jgi:S1-C subfamily serine protease|tara:strand:+ start:2637 stop:3353 length:717 start_codon:yes stop_codon:yes gene_type:complete
VKNLVFLVILIISSCITHLKSSSFENKRDDIFHSENIVKVEFVFMEECSEDACKTNRFIKTYGSGTIINKDILNTVGVLTAGHLCYQYSLSVKEHGKERNILKIYNNKMESYEATIRDYYLESDICLLKIEHYDNEIEKIYLREDAIIPGEEIFNIGAPTGLFSYNMVNRFRGFYAGNIALGDANNLKNVFNFPAVEGSSGSPIFDDEGLLIGIVSMFSKDFNYIILSPTIPELRKRL